MRILVADGDENCLRSIEMMLKSESFNVYGIDSGEEAAELGKLYDYDCIVLSETPDLSWLTVIRRLRLGKVRTPILVLSGLAAVVDIVNALGVGADDYLPKPFHKDELVARIHSLVRRSRGHAQPVITTGNLTVNLSTKMVSVDGVSVHLTSKEYAMLELLSLRKGSTLTKEMFLNHIYGGRDEPEVKIIDVFICKLRKKLRAAGGQDIETVWGRGYVLRDPAAVKVGTPSLAPEVRDIIDNPPTGYVPNKTFLDRRADDIAAGKLKSPSLVPAQGQR